MKTLRGLKLGVVLFLGLILFLSPVAGTAEAKPAYCDNAYWACYEDCYYMLFPMLISACRYGCYLGYESCGEP